MTNLLDIEIFFNTDVDNITFTNIKKITIDYENDLFTVWADEGEFTCKNSDIDSYVTTVTE
jgi:hypothetical protein